MACRPTPPTPRGPTRLYLAVLVLALASALGAVFADTTGGLPAASPWPLAVAQVVEALHP